MIKLSYWIQSEGKKCPGCNKELPKRIRRNGTGYCHPCRMKLKPPGLGSKRPDAVAILNKYRPKGKDNYFFKVKFKGKDHARWKGDQVGYYALHTWVQRELGKPTTCEFCGKKNLKGRYIQWANKSGDYLRSLSDWIRLCTKCHWHYDRDKKYDKA